VDRDGQGWSRMFVPMGGWLGLRGRDWKLGGGGPERGTDKDGAVVPTPWFDKDRAVVPTPWLERDRAVVSTRVCRNEERAVGDAVLVWVCISRVV
jgi:hypothetical protein